MSDPVDLGPIGGAVWSDTEEWARRRSAAGCIVCLAGEPLNIIAELGSCWVTAPRRAALPGYVCVIARQHVIEPFEMTVEEQSRFWRDAMVVARAVADLVRPIKMNYEIHGNTLPYLHLHLFPRQAHDPFVGGPIDASTPAVVRTDAEIEALASAIQAAAVEVTDR